MRELEKRLGNPLMLSKTAITYLKIPRSIHVFFNMLIPVVWAGNTGLNPMVLILVQALK